MRHKVAARRVGGGCGNSRNAETGKESCWFLRGNRIVEVSSKNAEFRRESMVDANVLFAVVKRIAPDPSYGLVGEIGKRRNLCEDVLDVRGRHRVDVRYCVSGCRAVAARVVRGTNRDGQCATDLGLRGQFAARKGIVRDHAPPLLRIEEESLVFRDRAAHSEAEIVPAQRWAGNSKTIVEEVVCGHDVIAEKFVSTAVERIRARTGYYVDDSSGTAAVLGQIAGAQHFELRNGIDAGII